MHEGGVSARARDAAVVPMFDAVHDLRHRVLLHSTAHQQLQVILTRNLPVGGGVGAKRVGVHRPAVLKLPKVGDY